MRLIDADKIIYTWIVDDYGNRHDGVTLESIINRMPTIEPRKKGKWINHRCDDGYHIADCDQCGHSLQWFDDDIPKYCCACGAEMGDEYN